MDRQPAERMQKRAPLTWLENRFLQRHFRGCGVEIGALWRRFPTPAHARVWYVDRFDGAALADHYPELGGRILRPDLLAEATALPVAPRSLNFLIASHVLEHMPYPLQALRAWYDALAPGGVLLLKVPDKRYTFDVKRARTPLDRLLSERGDRREHYADWVENVGNRRRDAPGFDDEVDDLMRRNYSIHFHVWIDEDIREIIEFTRREWRFDWEPVVFWGAHVWRREVTALLMRSAASKPED